MDGLDRLSPQDRFRVYTDVILEGSALRGNFVFLVSRPFHFGSFADEAVMRRGQEACFQISFDAIDEKKQRTYLGSAFTKGLDKVGVYNPELLLTPLLLRMIQLLHDPDAETDIDNKTGLYSRYFQLVLKGEKALPMAVVRSSPSMKAEPETKPTESSSEEESVVTEEANSESQKALAKISQENVEGCLDRLAEVAYGLALDGRFPRFEEVDNGIEWSRLGDPGDPRNPLWSEQELVPEVENVIHHAQECWGYRHPSFQEFLAARRLAQEPGWEDVVRKHCRDERWSEVFKFFGWNVR